MTKTQHIHPPASAANAVPAQAEVVEFDLTKVSPANHEVRTDHVRQPQESAAASLAVLPAAKEAVSTDVVVTIRHWLETAANAARLTIYCQVRAGLELLQLQKASGARAGRPGKFSHSGKIFPEVIKELGLTQTTAYRYIDMAKAAKPRLEKLTELKGIDLSQVPLSSLTEPQAKALDQTVHKLTDGLTQQEFFKNLYKGGGKKRGGARESTEDAEPSLEEAAAATKAAAINDWSEIESKMRYYAGAFTLLDDDIIEAQLANLTLAVEARRTWLAQARTTRDAGDIAKIFGK